jgi:WXG100 family type VII secretion target
VTSFEATPVDLQVTGHRLADLAEDVEQAARPLRTDADELLGGTWRGGAARGFGSGFREWEAGLAEVVRALRTLAEETGAAGRAYAGRDEQGRRTIADAGRGA